MQHFSKKFERVGASPSFPEVSPKFPRSFPDVLQFGGQPTPPTMRPFLASSSARPSCAAALRDVEVDAPVEGLVQLLPAVGRQDGDAAEVPGLFKWTNYDSTGGGVTFGLPACLLYFPTVFRRICSTFREKM